MVLSILFENYSEHVHVYIEVFGIPQITGKLSDKFFSFFTPAINKAYYLVKLASIILNYQFLKKLYFYIIFVFIASFIFIP